MRIEIDETYTYTYTDLSGLTSLFRGKIEADYEKLGLSERLLAKVAARKALEWLEQRVQKDGGDIDAVRPPKKADPVPFLFRIGSVLLGEMLKHVTIRIDTKKNTITTLITGKDSREDGGSVVIDGNLGQWQDNSLEIPGCDVQPSLSDCAPLHP